MWIRNGICWHSTERHNECRINHFRNGDKLFFYGRCKSGQRWFWAAHNYRIGKEGDEEGEKVHGWEDTEQAALAAARAAIVHLTHGGKRSRAIFWAGIAYSRLKEVNTAKRAARPPSGRTHSQVTEYLYSIWGMRCPILKATKKRIFTGPGEKIDEHGMPTGEADYHYDIQTTRTGYIERQEIEPPAIKNAAGM